MCLISDKYDPMSGNDLGSLLSFEGNRPLRMELKFVIAYKARNVARQYKSEVERFRSGNMVMKYL